MVSVVALFAGIAVGGDVLPAGASLIGTITTVAGTDTAGSDGDGELAILAQLGEPTGVAVDGAGNLFIADYVNHRVRRVDTAGVITTVAGTGVAGFDADHDGEAAVNATLNFPTGVVVDSAGNVFIADQLNHRIRQVDTAGTITTVAGTGEWGFNGDNQLATAAELNWPTGVAMDSAGNVFIADSFNHRVRRVSWELTATDLWDLAFLQPMNPSEDDGEEVTVAVNEIRNGRVIPVKVQINNDGEPQTGTDGELGDFTVGVTGTECPNNGSTTGVEEDPAAAGESNAGTDQLRWSDGDPGHWVYNLDTRALKLQNNQCYRIDVYTDGETKTSTSQWIVIKTVR